MGILLRKEDCMANKMILNEVSYFGAGCISAMADEIKARGLRKALIVTDRDLIEFNVTQKVMRVLEGAGLAYTTYDDVAVNPTVKLIHGAVDFFKQEHVDYIIAVGGGSVIDTAKAVGIIVNNPEFEDVRSLEGLAATTNKSVPIIAVPTTAGTASEVTVNYVLTDSEKYRKFVCIDPHDIPIIAFVDSDMMSSMPKKLTASTGMDALTHAIEGYICKNAWEMSDMFTLKAIEIISRSLVDAVKNDPDAREDMALGQYIAGMGFSNCGLGIVHSMAHPLGAVYDAPHGIANAILLPVVMEFNADAAGEKYRDIAKAMGVENTEAMTPEEYRRAAVDKVRELSDSIGIPKSLLDIGVQESDLQFLAESAVADVCTGGNPKDVTVEDILALYKSIM